MSFKLADLINIAVDEKNYYRSEEWCERQKDKLLVEHDQEDWQRQFTEAFVKLTDLEKQMSVRKSSFKS